MTIFATIEDLLEVDPQINNYGELDFEQSLIDAQEDVIKLLKVRWWPEYIHNVSRDITRITGVSPTLVVENLDETQWTKITCYYALAHYIFPKMTKFESDVDAFENRMTYFSKRTEELLDLEIRSGVRYDVDNDHQFNEVESSPTSFLRLKR